MAQPNEDRRKFPRFSFERRMRFKWADGREWKSFSRILNISEGGLQLVSRDLLPPLTVLDLQINGSHDEPGLSLRGRVIWSHPAPDRQDLYYCGLSFLDLRDDARSIIFSHTS